MPVLSATQLEKLRYSAQGWNKIHEENMRKLEDTLLKVSGMLDVDLTALANGDVLAWSVAKQKFENVPRGSVIPTTTTTTSTTTTTTGPPTTTTTTVTGTTTTTTTSSSTTSTTSTTSSSTTTTTAPMDLLIHSDELEGTTSYEDSAP